jgi:multiple sugar transport system ATP-binding protein
MIAGLEEISSGELRIGGKVVNDLPPRERDIAIVFQNYALYPHMTAYDNLAFGLKIRGLPKAVIREKVLNAAKILDIETLLHRKPKEMSGGQRQRVAIGRAIVRNPSVFLFDEPLSNLDAKLRGQMRLEIARLHQQLKTTVVYVTHDQVEAMTLGDRIAVINQGEIQQIDTPDKVYEKPANRFVAGFVGSPPMNFIDGTLSGQGGELLFRDKAGAIEIKLPPLQVPESHLERAVTLGIRPEAIATRPGSASPGRYARFEVEIQLLERLGHENFAFARLGEREITARLSTETDTPALGAAMFYFDLSKLHFFDTVTGERI